MLRVAGVCALVCLLNVMLQSAVAAKDIEDLHKTLCPVGNVVSKKELLKHLLRAHPSLLEAFAFDPPASRTVTGLPLIVSLIADENACSKRDGCSKEAAAAVDELRIYFGNFVRDGNRARTYSSANPRMPASTYFKSQDDNTNPILCTRQIDLIETKDDKKDASRIRIRGVAADLTYDRSEKDKFKSASSAKLDYTDDRSSGKKFTTKVKTVVGYAVEWPATPNSTRQLIPYVSVNQLISDTAGQPRKLDDSNYVASGVVIDWLSTSSDKYSYRFSTTPQFLYNTKDRSQIASARLIYQPWFSLANDRGEFVFNVNTSSIYDKPRSVFRLLFDVRSDNGYYVRKGDISDRSLHNSFFRIGSQGGFAWTLIDYRLTLKVTETLLYGYIGNARKLDLFDASLSYSFDPNDYFALTIGYQKGRDENTTEAVQMWTAGLTVKY